MTEGKEHFDLFAAVAIKELCILGVDMPSTPKVQRVLSSSTLETEEWVGTGTRLNKIACRGKGKNYLPICHLAILRWNRRPSADLSA